MVTERDLDVLPYLQSRHNWSYCNERLLGLWTEKCKAEGRDPQAQDGLSKVGRNDYGPSRAVTP